MRVLVIGAYGLIGSEIVRILRQQQIDVIGLGRDVDLGRKLVPEIEWHQVDLTEQSKPAFWHNVLKDVEVVVNAAGALQTGLRDDLSAIHSRWLGPVLEAASAAGVRRFVQISAPGAVDNADTEFMSSKSAGDRMVAGSGLDYVILRPGLVLSRTAYGGTQLLRMVAAFPLVQPIAMGDARVQTVSVEDVAAAALQAVQGEIPSGSDIDLVENDAHTLTEIILEVRNWLGFSKPLVLFELPQLLVHLISLGADLLGWLGWRSPLRRTSIAVLSNGVVGDGQNAANILGRRLLGLSEILQTMPATPQDRLAARMSLLMPLMVGILSLFWLVSALVSIVMFDQAKDLAVSAGLPAWSVSLGIAADIALGCAVLYRPTAVAACMGMVVVTVCYLLMASVVAPELWGDPLGVLVKAIPAAVLAAVTIPLLAKR
jgi:uncharacterized protein YbjT (DUF2867 family)